MSKKMFRTAAMLGLLAVFFGGFSYHILEDEVTYIQFALFERGVLYHLLYTVAIVAVGALARSSKNALLPWVSGFFLGGIIFYSGSLYILGTQGFLWNRGFQDFFTPLTIVGEACFFIGWIFLLIMSFRSRSKK